MSGSATTTTWRCRMRRNGSWRRSKASGAGLAAGAHERFRDDLEHRAAGLHGAGLLARPQPRERPASSSRGHLLLSERDARAPRGLCLRRALSRGSAAVDRLRDVRPPRRALPGRDGRGRPVPSAQARGRPGAGGGAPRRGGVRGGLARERPSDLRGVSRNVCRSASTRRSMQASDPHLRRRAALLQRACVYARRNDWEAVLADLPQAAGSRRRAR